MTERRAIESTYWDRCSVYRMQQHKNPDTRQTEQAEELLQEDIPCALSRGQRQAGEHSVTDSHGLVKDSYVLFCAPEAPIIPGDRLGVVTSTGQRLILWAGAGFCYPSHAEIPLSEERPV